MNSLTLWRKLKRFFLEVFFDIPPEQPKISILIPFSSKDHQRKRVHRWLKKYWAHELPDAEIIVGKSSSKPFCKGEALNDAASRATGKIIVILDADAYMPGQVIDHAADRILEEIEAGERLWYVPYRHLYRLTEGITGWILLSDPKHPLRVPSPPPPDWVVGQVQSTYGHRYGAMVMVFPREALDILGCFDERFKGWGGEDVALLRALDTLYAKHKTTDNDVLHLWHPVLGKDYKSRIWEGQEKGQVNTKLSNEYNRASRNPTAMRALVDAGCEYRKNKKNFIERILDGE